MVKRTKREHTAVNPLAGMNAKTGIRKNVAAMRLGGLLSVPSFALLCRGNEKETGSASGSLAQAPDAKFPEPEHCLHFVTNLRYFDKYSNPYLDKKHSPAYFYPVRRNLAYYRNWSHIRRLKNHRKRNLFH